MLDGQLLAACVCVGAAALWLALRARRFVLGGRAGGCGQCASGACGAQPGQTAREGFVDAEALAASGARRRQPRDATPPAGAA